MIGPVLEVNILIDVSELEWGLYIFNMILKYYLLRTGMILDHILTT